MKQVPWNSLIIDEFVSLASLNEDEENILRTRANGWSQVQQAEQFGMSISSINRIVRRLKSKYDSVQPFSATMPPRMESAADLYR